MNRQRQKMWVKIIMLLCAGVFLFNHSAYARHYTESHMLDDFFKSDGDQAAIFAVTTIGSVFVPYLSVAAGACTAATASAGIVISTVVNIGSQIAVAAGADPQTTMIVGGVVGGLASGGSNVANAATPLNTMQTIGIIGLHTAAWSTQAVVAAELMNKMDPTLASLCGMASGMAVQGIGSWTFNKLSGNTDAYMDPGDMSVGFYEGQSEGFGATLSQMAKLLPGMAISTAARWGVNQALGDDAKEPWASPLANLAGGVGIFLGNYATGAAGNLLSSSHSSSSSGDNSFSTTGNTGTGALLSTGQSGNFLSDLTKELLTVSARYGVQAGFAYANNAVNEASQNGNWSMPSYFLLNSAEGFASMAAAGGVGLLYDTATGAQTPTYGDIFHKALAEGVASTMPFYESQGTRAGDPEGSAIQGEPGQMYRYTNYIHDVLSFNTNLPREVPQALEKALKGADSSVRELILAIYLNPSMPSTGYNLLQMSSNFANTGASALGEKVGGLAFNQMYGINSPYHIYNGMAIPYKYDKETGEIKNVNPVMNADGDLNNPKVPEENAYLELNKGQWEQQTSYANFLRANDITLREGESVKVQDVIAGKNAQRNQNTPPNTNPTVVPQVPTSQTFSGSTSGTQYEIERALAQRGSLEEKYSTGK